MIKHNSDHNPLMWETVKVKRNRVWRINDDHLLRKENLDLIQKEIRCYFKENMGKGTPSRTIWDAFKAVQRGILINLNNKDKRIKELKLKNIQERIKTLEQQANNSSLTQKESLEFTILKDQLNTLLQKEIEWNLRRIKQKQFEYANKPGRYRIIES